ncbi:MAG: valine--tRNA ligase [Patescibacteria group bacterium]
MLKQSDKLNKSYDPELVEEKIYELWEKSGCFNPDSASANRRATKADKIQNFCIIMPPPNANGSLHLGHALMIALEDAMIRYHRMNGYKTLWLPGADHAGFETQVVYEKKLEKEGSSRFEILKQEGGRDKLYKMIWDFTQENKSYMEDQIKQMGASCDWSRKKFTLDQEIVKSVYRAFKKLYDDKLAYRESAGVNWCAKHQTTLSDLEIKHAERKDALYYIDYGPLAVATVRPETIFADAAVAVNPKDKRYKHLIGKTAKIPLIGKEIKIIGDDSIDIKFGTGAVKITPAHDHNDFEIAKRHGLAFIKTIDEFGRLVSPAPEKYVNMKIGQARESVVADLKIHNLIKKTDENYIHAVATCYKCGTVLEPAVKTQWFIKMTERPKNGGLSLRDAAVKAVKSGKIKFIPKRFEKIFFYWMKNLRDWNISRQIVWGIRIPAWYCVKPNIKNAKEALTHSANTIIIAENGEIPEKCPDCGSEHLEQDRDVFDTWFSSGQWPFLVLGYPDKKDFKNFYPTTVMETGWDIMFFWVARMIMLGLYRTGKIPFKHVYLHGLVRDKDKQKMSKSKGNVVDPLGVVSEYGADALRMALIVGNAPGNDLAYSEDKVRGYRNFANKIWQASRFVLMNLENFDLNAKPKLSAADKKKLNELTKIKKDVSKLIESFKFYAAAEKIYHYFWHTFCDKIIEEMKPRLHQDFGGQARLKNDDLKDKQAAQYVLLEILTGSLKLLHPFMPFITEEIYQNLAIEQVKNKKMLITEKW